MSLSPERYGVIGNPIAHSKSPDIHAEFARQTGQHMVYERILAPVDAFAASVHALIAQGFRGANVTVPFKLEAYALATFLTERAQAAGAVNTLKFESGRIVGDNTDGIGLVTDIVANAGVALRGRRVLLLGAGGAARGVILPILAELPEQLVIANRTVSKAEELAAWFASKGPVCARDYTALHEPYDVIINATSASLSADLPPVGAEVYGAESFAYDMMYGTEPTVFMQFASRHGASTRDGLGMLVEQAAESFMLWRGVRPATASVFAMLHSRL